MAEYPSPSAPGTLIPFNELPFGGLLRSNPLAVSIVDAGRHVLFLNPAFEKLFGFTQVESAGRRIEELTGGAANPGEVEQIQRQALAGEAPHIRTRRRRRDGTELDIEMHVGPLLFEGSPGATFGIYRDLTAEAKAQDELSRFFMLSRDLLCVCGFDGYFTQVNPSFQRVLGHAESTLFAEPFISFVHPEDQEATVLEFSKAVRGEVIAGFENRYRCADGTYRWLQWATMSAVETRTVYAAARDTTERRRAEQQLQEALQLKTDFISFVTHQLRTPLSGIKWMLELSTESADRQESDSYVQDARESANRLIALVNDLLDVTRLENGRMELRPELIDLHELTESVLGDLATLVRERQHDLQVSVDTPRTSVVADPQLLRQVVLNFLSNAIKYTPSGGRLRVRIGEDGGSLRWEVEDSGIGIPQASRARLFEKFFRAENAQTIDTEGTGLGLYLVRLVVEQFGGHVECESEEGRGSTFRFLLPPATAAPEVLP
jgi:PAS domain S-box-containing protein